MNTIAECDEYYMFLSFKGKRDKEFFIQTLHRMPYHNRTREECIEYLMQTSIWDSIKDNPNEIDAWVESSRIKKRGISRQQACILTCLDRSGGIFVKPVCVSTPTTKNIKDAMSGIFSNDAVLVTDSRSSYDKFADDEHLEHVSIESGKHNNGAYNLGKLNGYHSDLNLRWSTSKKNMPATKYLDIKMLFMRYLEKNKDKSSNDLTEMIFDILRQTDFDK